MGEEGFREREQKERDRDRQRKTETDRQTDRVCNWIMASSKHRIISDEKERREGIGKSGRDRQTYRERNRVRNRN